MNRLLPFLFFFFVLACKSTSEMSSSASKKMSAKQLSKQMLAADYAFDFLQAKARIKFDDGSINQSFTANIRIENNSTIWMSLTGPFGIEGARVMMNKDRIQIIDRLNNKYYDEEYTFIDKYLSFQTSLLFLQNLIVGNVFQDELSKYRVLSDQDNYIINYDYNGLEAKYTVSPNYKYRRVEMDEKFGSRNIEMDFNDYKFIDEQLFAMLRNIHFSENGKDVFIEMNFSKVKKEIALEFPFNVPDRLKN
ncbi:MAG: DUF4292 domain-containing protein [Chitinophagales bacterium]|nr:DUF4292 domain-containing protein [Chitinophagales bacterium]MDC3209160.1 DUF4292 domain-containing protein [Chitinophagales bacterium]